MKSKVYLIIKVIQNHIIYYRKEFQIFYGISFSLSESKIAILYRYLYLNKYANRIGRNVFIGKFVTIKHR